MISDCTPNLSGVIDRKAPYSAVNQVYDVMLLKSNRVRSKHKVSGSIGNRFDQCDCSLFFQDKESECVCVCGRKVGRDNVGEFGGRLQISFYHP